MRSSDTKTEVDKLIERLHDPVQLRVLLTALCLLIGYFAIYTPFSGNIDASSRLLDKEQKRQELAHDLDFLRAQVESFETRLPRDTDTNEWVQYVLGGVRRFPLKLNALDSAKPRKVGPYEVVVLKMELEGGYENLDAFLHWLEMNDRMFRVDATKVTPARKHRDRLTMQLTVLGMKG